MSNSFNEAFNSFKRQTWQSKNVKPIDIMFMLVSDASGTFLEIVDKNLTPVEVNYQAYTGEIRNILRQIDSIKERNAFVIEWGKEQGSLYLAEHEHLLYALKNTDLLVNEGGQKLHFAEEEHKVGVHALPSTSFLALFPIQSQKHFSL